MGGAEGSSELVMAGWWDRFTAYFVDGLILIIPSLVVLVALAAAEVDSTAFLFVLQGLYFVYFWSSAGGGRTLGMRSKRIAVVGADGSPISVGRAVIRYIMFIVSFYALLLGLLWAAWDPKKQGWHDKVAGTFVVRRRAAHETPFAPLTEVAYGRATASAGTLAPPGADSAAGRMRCGRCGTLNDDARFCGSCGAPLTT